MTEAVITSAIICRKVEHPDGPEGGATLVGVAQQIVFLAAYKDPVFMGALYLNVEGGSANEVTLRWMSEAGHIYEAHSPIPFVSAARVNRAELALQLPCPMEGWYVLEILLDGAARSRQSVEVRQVQP